MNNEELSMNVECDTIGSINDRKELMLLNDTTEENPKLSHHNVKDILGQKYGKLLVINFSHIENKSAYWKCICDCGRGTSIHRGSCLRRGTIKSCGCMPWGRTKGINREDVMLRFEFSSKIKKKKYVDLSFEDWKSIVKCPCYYCGREYSIILKDNRGWNNGKLLTDTIVQCNGIDRVDSSIGYTKTNCVSCCSFCNRAKMNLSQPEFYKHITRLYENLHRKGRINGQ